MSKTIDAMKQALAALAVATTPIAKDRQEVLMARVALSDAIAAEEAQTVEPAPRGERTSLIERLTKQWSELDALDPFRADVGLAADMLAADADLMTQLARRTVERDMAIDMAICSDAQQVAVQQGYALVPIEPTQEMVEAYSGAMYDDDESVEAGNVWKAMLSAAPSQPQAAQRVPMTDMEIYTAMASITEDPEPASEIIGCDDWPEIVDMIRRTEAHHGIKP